MHPERGGDIFRLVAVHRHAKEHLAVAGLDRLVVHQLPERDFNKRLAPGLFVAGHHA